MSQPVEHLPERHTIAEYLEREYASAVRHEYYEGTIVAMAGGSPQHSLIISNLIGETRLRLKGADCRVYDSNLRVRVPYSRMYVYPDVTVVCGPTRHDADDAKRQTVTNPKLIVEVLSDSTENLDYGPKFRNYIECETLDEYVIVTQDAVHVQSYFRQNDRTWLFTPVTKRDGVLKLHSLGLELPVAEVYAGVEFSAASASPTAVPAPPAQ